MDIHKKIEETPVKGSYTEACVNTLLDVIAKNPPRKNLGGTGSDNAFYGGVCVSGGVAVMKSYSYPCHAFMSSLENVKAVYNRFTKRPTCSKEATKNYFLWFMSGDSPWREFKGRLFSHTPTIKDPYGRLSQDDKLSMLSFIYENGWVWSDLSAPANLQHNFLVASRAVSEWPKLISKWNIWQKCGANKALAFVFQDMFHPQRRRGPNNVQYWRINRSSLYDWALDACTANDDYVRNFMTGKVSNLTHPFSENPHYIPVNRVFGDTGIYIGYEKTKGDNYPTILFKRYNKDTGTDGRFGMSEEDAKKYWTGHLGWDRFSYDSHWVVTENDILEIIKLEEKRLVSGSTVVAGDIRDIS